MIATIGLPGGAHHRWTRVKTRKEAAIWLEKADDLLQAKHPAAHPQPTFTVTEREAARTRYQDGTAVYPKAELETAEEDRHRFTLEEIQDALEGHGRPYGLAARLCVIAGDQAFAAGHKATALSFDRGTGDDMLLEGAIGDARFYTHLVGLDDVVPDVIRKAIVARYLEGVLACHDAICNGEDY